MYKPQFFYIYITHRLANVYSSDRTGAWLGLTDLSSLCCWCWRWWRCCVGISSTLSRGHHPSRVVNAHDTAPSDRKSGTAHARAFVTRRAAPMLTQSGNMADVRRLWFNTRRACLLNLQNNYTERRMWCSHRCIVCLVVQFTFSSMFFCVEIFIHHVNGSTTTIKKKKRT